jgi:hypothetical protein
LGADVGDHPGEGPAVGAAVHDTHQLERSVEPRPEALGEHVVRLSRRRSHRVVALVGRAETQGEEGKGDDHDAHEGDGGGHDRTALHEVRPPGPETLGAGADDTRSVLGQVRLLTS